MDKKDTLVTFQDLINKRPLLDTQGNGSGKTDKPALLTHLESFCEAAGLVCVRDWTNGVDINGEPRTYKLLIHERVTNKKVGVTIMSQTSLSPQMGWKAYVAFADYTINNLNTPPLVILDGDGWDEGVMQGLVATGTCVHYTNVVQFLRNYFNRF